MVLDALKSRNSSPDNDQSQSLSFVSNNFRTILYLIFGVTLFGGAIFVYKLSSITPKIEIIQEDQAIQNISKHLRVEIVGAITNPGVYTLTEGARVEDLIATAGGLIDSADKDWVTQTLNRASKLTDGQKLVIPNIDQQSSILSASNNGEGEGSNKTSNLEIKAQNNLININIASQHELESLWGIGPKIGQKIIEQRPYSDINQLLSKKIISKTVYEKIKDKISVY